MECCSDGGVVSVSVLKCNFERNKYQKILLQKVTKFGVLAREVNKNNLLGGQFLIFCQKSRKIINWVGSLHFLSGLTQIMCFPQKLRDVSPFQCGQLIHNVGFHEQEC